MSKHAIVDLSKVQYLSCAAMAAKVKRVCEHYSISLADVSVIASAGQAGVREHLDSTVVWIDILSTALASQKAREVLQVLSARGSTAVVVVVSYSGAVLSLAKEPWNGLVVTGVTYKQLRETAAAVASEAIHQPVSASGPARQEVLMAGAGSVGVNACQPAGDDREHRSRVFGEKLASLHMGPFADARLEVYAAVSELVNAGLNLRLVDLVKEAAVEAAKAVSAKGRKPQPWAAITAFIERLLPEAGVLLDVSEQVIEAGWDASFVEVGKLCPDWEIKADAEIVFALVRAEEICERDVPNVARAIYHSADPDAQVRVRRAIVSLIKCKKVEPTTVNGQRGLRVKQPCISREEAPIALKLTSTEVRTATGA